MVWVWPRAAKRDLRTKAAPDPRPMGTSSAIPAIRSTGRYLLRAVSRLSSYATVNMKIATCEIPTMYGAPRAGTAE